MKAIVAREYGPLEGLEYADWPEPEAKGRTVVIAADMIGVNYPDGLLVQGLYQMKPPTPVPCCAASAPRTMRSSSARN